MPGENAFLLHFFIFFEITHRVAEIKLCYFYYLVLLKYEQMHTVVHYTHARVHRHTDSDSIITMHITLHALALVVVFACTLSVG